MPSVAFCLALLLQVTPASRPVSLRALELDVRLEPATRILSAKARLDIVSRRVLPLTQLVLVLPPPFAERARVQAVWDATGLLAWHVQSAGEELRISVTLAKPLPSLSRRTVVMSFDLDLTGVDSALVKFTHREVQLASSGWYPFPENLLLDSLPRVRLGVRLPRTWRVQSTSNVKRLRTGPEFAEYELKAKNVRAGALLFAASAE